jgi:hypothetical protein
LRQFSKAFPADQQARDNQKDHQFWNAEFVHLSIF